MSGGHKHVLGDLTNRLTERFKAVDAGEQPLHPAPPRAKSAPGHLLDLSGANREIADLRATLKQHEGSKPTRLLDPADIVLSRFTNRHPDSYKDAEYLSLRDEIRAAGGNTQPIGVRPKAAEPGKYELSFGSRRRQACFELGLPVLAMIEEMDEISLFERMERENRGRKDLRPYEQGTLYRQALDAKLYPSMRKLAEALQIDSGGLTRLLAVARLPHEVISAFRSPLDIQAKWGPLLSDAIERNGTAVFAKAAELKAVAPRLPAHRVIEELVACATERHAGPRPKTGRVEMEGKNGQVATLTFRRNGASVEIKNVAPERRAALEKVIRDFLGS